MFTHRLFFFVYFAFGLQNIDAQNLFIQNKGQQDKVVKYSKNLNNGRLYYRSEGFTTLLRDNATYDSMWEHFHKHKSLKKSFRIKYHRYDVNFINALPCDIESLYPSVTKLNYYIGKDSKHWASDVSMYHQLVYHNLYNGINLEVTEKGNAVKHNFIVAPDADVNDIILEYKYASGLRLNKQAIEVVTSVGSVSEAPPVAFQLNGYDTLFIPCKYLLQQKQSSFEIRFQIGDYDKNKKLIIDPLLIFATYSGSQGDNFGFTATHDSKAMVYSAGIVDGNDGPFPVTPGAYQINYGGGADIDPLNPGKQGRPPANLSCDIGINKYDSAGTILLYSTYLGGNDDEFPHSLVTDNADNLLIMGTTYSNNFPVIKTCYDTLFAGQTDIFVAKLSKNGSVLMKSTYIGGSDFDGLNSRTLRYNYADDFRGDIVLDSLNNVFVASTTYSNNFPILNAFQPVKGSTQEGCIFSLDSDLQNLKFSSFAGGNADDACYSIRLYDSFVYIGGGTSSAVMNFTLNGMQNTYNGGRADGYIIKLRQDGTFRNASYFGTVQYDQIYFIDIDMNGQIYGAGQTEGSLTRTTGTYGKDNTSQFIMRMSPNLSNINLQTTFGNRTFNPEISPSAFLVDQCENIYFSGWGSDISHAGLHSLTTFNLPVTPDAIQSITDQEDFYLLVMNKNAKNLLYATYFGGDKTGDHVDGGTSRFDKKGVVYQAVCASCPGVGGNQDFPVTPLAPFTWNPSSRCSNATFKIDFQITFLVDASFTANPTNGCAPLNVTFNNTSKYGKKFFWDFGDGSPVSNIKNPSHTYPFKGVYKVRLTTVDSFSCNISESDSTEIVVLENPIADFKVENEPCDNLFKFTNLSTNYINPYWTFGDNGDPSTSDNPEYRYSADGVYTVLLRVEHPTSGCIDTQSQIVILYSDPTKSLRIPNVFTPNNDGKNDCYTIDGIDPACDEAYVWVFNRWGILVFEGDLPANCWNGKLFNDGVNLPDGVYYYLMDIRSKIPKENENDSVHHTNGVIQLIRD